MPNWLRGVLEHLILGPLLAPGVLLYLFAWLTRS